MIRKKLPFLCVMLFTICGTRVIPILAEERFFADKTMRIIVATSPGGGFDAYARLVARHWRNHIPGNPTIIVQNMPGGGHLIGANYVYKIAKPDGLTAGHFVGTLLAGQALGRSGIEFDARRFTYIGSPSRAQPVCALSKRTGIASLEEWRASGKRVPFGAIGPGDATYEHAKILQAALGLPMEVIPGYKGTAPIRVAVEAGEVDGVCMDWNSLKVTGAEALAAGSLRVVVQLMPTSHPELPQVPMAISLAITSHDRQLIQLGIHDRSVYQRPFVLPPDVPRQRIEILRNSFMAALKDPELVKEATKSGLEIDPVVGDELEKSVRGLFEVDPKLIAKLREVLR